VKKSINRQKYTSRLLARAGHNRSACTCTDEQHTRTPIQIPSSRLITDSDIPEYIDENLSECSVTNPSTRRKRASWSSKPHHTQVIMMQRVAFTAGKGLRSASRALFSSDLSNHYHIEVSNAHNPTSTQLTVSGPDVDGILASMNEDGSISRSNSSASQIKDIFLVVDRSTGTQFQDDQLKPLASSLLESLKTPINTLSLTTAKASLQEMEQNLEGQGFTELEDQITVLPSTASITESA
jgi:hypothetical protein